MSPDMTHSREYVHSVHKQFRSSSELVRIRNSRYSSSGILCVHHGELSTYYKNQHKHSQIGSTFHCFLGIVSLFQIRLFDPFESR